MFKMIEPLADCEIGLLSIFECKKCETGWYTLSDMWSIQWKCHEWWNGEEMD
jgi:hypothetical protein